MHKKFVQGSGGLASWIKHPDAIYRQKKKVPYLFVARILAILFSVETSKNGSFCCSPRGPFGSGLRRASFNAAAGADRCACYERTGGGIRHRSPNQVPASSACGHFIIGIALHRSIAIATHIGKRARTKRGAFRESTWNVPYHPTAFLQRRLSPSRKCHPLSAHSPD